MEDPLIATITVQNSKSVFRMQFNFEECTVQTNMMDQFCSLLQTFSEILKACNKEAEASYAAAGVQEMQKFKEEVIQSYLGRPSSLFGHSPRGSKEFADPEPADPALSSLKPIPSPRVSMGSQSCGVVGGTPGPSGSTVSARTNSTPEELMGSKSSPSSSVSAETPRRGLQRFWNYFGGSTKVQPMGAESVTIEPGNQSRERKGKRSPPSSKDRLGDCSDSFSSLSIPQP